MTEKLQKRATRLISEAKAKGLTIATAESCTGGYIGKILTDIPGASAVYYGGIISYDNCIKINVLGVNKETLDQFGAVSEETARQMAFGARKLMDTDFAISVTGIAGPGGGTATKPVGMVCFGISNRFVTQTLTTQFGDLGRNKIRKKAVKFALKMLQEAVQA